MTARVEGRAMLHERRVKMGVAAFVQQNSWTVGGDCCVASFVEID